MIVYSNSTKGFQADVDTNKIVDKIKEAYFQKTLKTRFNESEASSWNNSLQFMEKIIRRSGVPGDCGVMIEFGLPSTSKRIDFIISGKDEAGKKNFIIIELKQWQDAQSTTTTDLVLTKYYAGRYSTHPSYQASSYKRYISDFNESVSTGHINAYSCAYLHNYKEKKPEPLKDSVYSESIIDSPVYFKDDYEKLELFIRKHVGFGDGNAILYEIENGNIRPSKSLIEHVASLFNGNKAFTLLDEQKVTYEITLAKALQQNKKSVVIINGGPGTGKSVLSMTLLGELLQNEQNVIFVAPNSSFRDVMLDKLTQGRDASRAKHLLSGSAKFYETQHVFQTIIVDEAHRLKNEKAFMYKGDNQIYDIIKASNVTIFFIDEDQLIRPEDIGTIKEIKRLAHYFNCEIAELELQAQFRCSGADGYLNWISDVLEIKTTANYDGWSKKDFEFKIYDTPSEVKDVLNTKRKDGFTARMLAGYAWQWTSEKDGNSDAQVNDVSIPEYGFEMPWNSRKVGTTWALSQEGANQVGCVHTAQGLEFDYVGVIIGKDLKYNPVASKYYSDWNSYKDAKGKQGLRSEPEAMCKMVRNIYRILLTRGMKGCYVFCEDKDLQKYMKERLANTSD